jgi:hypothetical protein
MKKTTKMKPDYRDMDKDGNRKEPMKAAMNKAPGTKAAVKGRPANKTTKMTKRKTK